MGLISGAYVPGGRLPIPVRLMNAIPAVVAGVERLVMGPSPDGS